MVLFIGPPFGNYISLPNTISIKGSYTLHHRPGLLSQIWKTLHYSYEHGGWINKIGLRNPGIDVAVQNYKDNNKNKTTIYSVAILEKEEIPILLDKIPSNMNIELNVSCPNAEKSMIYCGLADFINPTREWCIIKLSPETKTEMIDKFYEQGFRQFHCSNTLPTLRGGLSGSKLIPYTSKLVKYIKGNYTDTVVIAGGGIQRYDNLLNYGKMGADHYAISTIFFHPFLCTKFFYDYYSQK